MIKVKDLEMGNYPGLSKCPTESHGSLTLEALSQVVSQREMRLEWNGRREA